MESRPVDYEAKFFELEYLVEVALRAVLRSGPYRQHEDDFRSEGRLALWRKMYWCHDKPRRRVYLLIYHAIRRYAYRNIYRQLIRRDSLRLHMKCVSEDAFYGDWLSCDDKLEVEMIDLGVTAHDIDRTARGDVHPRLLSLVISGNARGKVKVAEEDLFEMLSGMEVASVAGKLGVSPKVVYAWKKKYGFDPIRRIVAMPDRDRLIDLLRQYPVSEVAVGFGVDRRTIVKWAKKLGMDNPSSYFEKPISDRQQLIDLLRTHSVVEVASKLGVEAKKVHRRARAMGTDRVGFYFERYVPDRDRLIDLLRQHPVVEVAVKLGVDRRTIVKWAKKLGMDNPSSYFEKPSPDRDRLIDLLRRYPVGEVASMLGVDSGTVGRWARKLGMDSPGSYFVGKEAEKPTPEEFRKWSNTKLSGIYHVRKSRIEEWRVEASAPAWMG